MNKQKTIEQFENELKGVWGDKYIVSPSAVYKNTHTKIDVICSKHGLFSSTPNSLLHGHGCKECRRETIGKNRVLSQENVIERLKIVWGNKYDLSAIKYINARTKITPICRIHGAFKTRFSDFEKLHGCPLCNESRLENEIDKFLNDNFLTFYREYKTEWLKNGVGVLKLDFYLPDYNIAIECQGKQHYTEKSKYGKNGEFINIQNRDNAKFDLCEKHSIKLLYYTDYKGEIPEKYKQYTFFDKNKLLKEIKRNEQP